MCSIRQDTRHDAVVVKRGVGYDSSGGDACATNGYEGTEVSQLNTQKINKTKTKNKTNIIVGTCIHQKRSKNFQNRPNKSQKDVLPQ